MTDSLTYQRMGTDARNQAHVLFSQTMGYVAITAALFALGAWLGRNLTGAVGIIAFIAAFGCLIAMRFAVRSSIQLAVGLLGAFGLLIGLAVAPTIAYYGSMDPQALWQAGGRPRCSSPGSARPATRPAGTWPRSRGWRSGPWWADHLRHRGDLREHPGQRPGLLGARPGDLRRIRHVRLPAAAHQHLYAELAPLLAASIFLDILNVFLFFLYTSPAGKGTER